MRTATDPAPAVRVPEAAPSVSTTGTRFEWLARHARSVGLLAFVGLSFLWFARTWVDPAHRHAGISGDPEAYIFALAWPPFALTHHLNPLFTTYLIHPDGANLMWTIPPGFGLLLWPLTATIGVIPTYNLLATLSISASAWCAQLTLRRFAPGELGPFVGALFYGFSPYMTAHSTAHAMLTVAVLPPLLVLFLHEAFVRQRWPVWGTGIGLGALVAFQLSTFLELVAAGAIAAVLLLIALAIAYRHTLRERMRYFFTTLGIAFGSFVVLGGFQLWTVVFGSRNLTQLRSNVHPPNVYVADLLEFVVPTRYNASAFAFRSIAREFTSTGAEANAFIGLPLLIVVGIIVLHHRRARTVRIAAALTAVMAVLSMGPRLHIAAGASILLPWDLIAKLPLLGHLLPTRLSVFTDLGIAVLLAYGIGHRPRPASSRQRTITVIAGIAVVGSLLPSATLLGRLSDPVRVPSYFTSSAVERIPEGSVALVAPWTTDARNDAPEVWQAMSDFRFKMPSGYAYLPGGDGNVQTGTRDDLLQRALYQMGVGRRAPADPTDPEVRAELDGDLRRTDVETVIVGPMEHEVRVVRFFTEVFQRAPEHTGGVYVWYDVDDGSPDPAPGPRAPTTVAGL
jgi:hypothetical protein